MEKKNIKIGMIVRHRDDSMSIVMGNNENKMLYTYDGYIDMIYVNDDLTITSDHSLDIVEIFKLNRIIYDDLHNLFMDMFNVDNLESIWKRDNN